MRKHPLRIRTQGTHPPKLNPSPSRGSGPLAQNPECPALKTHRPPSFSGHEEKVHVNTSLFGKHRDSARGSEGINVFNEGCCVNSTSSEEGAGLDSCRRGAGRGVPPVLPIPASAAPGARSPAPAPSSSRLQGKTSPASAQPPRRAGREPSGDGQALAWASRTRSTGTERGRIVRDSEREVGV